MKIKLSSIFIFIAVIAVFVSCQSSEERNLDAQNQMLKEMNKQLGEQQKYNRTPEGQAKLDKQAKDDAARMREARCAVMWDRSRKVTSEIMGVTLSIESFECKNGKLYGTSIVAPGGSAEKRETKVWTADQIRKECPQNWSKWGHPCRK